MIHAAFVSTPIALRIDDRRFANGVVVVGDAECAGIDSR